MTQVTVAMPARNAARFIGAAIASVQQQGDVDWELVIVDDASTDDTVAIVRALDDPRIRLLHNPTHRGIAYSHNRIIAGSDAPYVAHLDADDYILPGALAKMIAALENNPNAGQAYCQFYDVDEDGEFLEQEFVTRTKMFQLRARGIDYRRDLVVVGTVINALRTYPRHVLNEIGGFNEALPYGEDYEYALRIADRYEFAFVPEFLYARRLHTQNSTETLSFKRWRYFWQRVQICRALERSQQVRYFSQKQYNLNRLLLASFASTLRSQIVPKAQKSISRN